MTIKTLLTPMQWPNLKRAGKKLKKNWRLVLFK